MAFKKGNCANPRGNPHIREISKKYSTGPRTKEGRLRVAVMLMSSGRNSKVLKNMRKSCDKCYLGPKIIEKVVGDRIVEIDVPAQCKFYEEGKRQCEMSPEMMIPKLKTFVELQKMSAKELQQALVMQAASDTEMSRQQETLTQGRPGFYTKEFQEQALKYNEGIMRTEEVEKKSIDIKSTAATLDINAIIKEEEEKIIAGEKPWPWEGKEDDEVKDIGEEQ